jgi:hypothetical protein
MSTPYEYALIRVVPRIDRGEFVNVGVILYCQDRNVLQADTDLDEHRLLALWPAVDVAGVRAACLAIARACDAPAVGTLRDGGGLGARFRWLTAPRSTVVQTGPIHAGISDDPRGEVTVILRRMVATQRTDGSVDG